MEINHKLSEGVRKYLTEMTGWWGEMIDKMSEEERTVLMKSICDNEPRYSEKDLDKAREEGRREQQKLDCELYGTAVATDEEVEEMWKTKLERMRDKAEKELDKLSNK